MHIGESVDGSPVRAQSHVEAMSRCDGVSQVGTYTTDRPRGMRS